MPVAVSKPRQPTRRQIEVALVYLCPDQWAVVVGESQLGCVHTKKRTSEISIRRIELSVARTCVDHPIASDRRSSAEPHSRAFSITHQHLVAHPVRGIFHA